MQTTPTVNGKIKIARRSNKTCNYWIKRYFRELFRDTITMKTSTRRWNAKNVKLKRNSTNRRRRREERQLQSKQVEDLEPTGQTVRVTQRLVRTTTARRTINSGRCTASSSRSNRITFRSKPCTGRIIRRQTSQELFCNELISRHRRVKNSLQELKNIVKEALDKAQTLSTLKEYHLR